MLYYLVYPTQGSFRRFLVSEKTLVLRNFDYHNAKVYDEIDCNVYNAKICTYPDEFGDNFDIALLILPRPSVVMHLTSRKPNIYKSHDSVDNIRMNSKRL